MKKYIKYKICTMYKLIQILMHDCTFVISIHFLVFHINLNPIQIW